jgi:acetyltransferase-like isoleucine patch superfamily enzyme
VAIGGTIDDPYLISIGDGAIIGQGSLVSGNASMNSKIVFGKVIIGKGVTISVNSVVLPTVEIGDNSVLSIGSVLLSGSVIPKEETWRGNPARKWQAMAASNS